MINIGSSKIAEMYVGSSKIAQAYVGSTKVYELSSPAPTGSYPSITNLKSGYFPSGYGTGTTYWWIPRTSRLITGERPFFCFSSVWQRLCRQAGTSSSRPTWAMT